MTGFNSKRKMAQDKMNDDDDTQVYADTLLIVYQRGYADGKQAAQRKPLTESMISAGLDELEAIRQTEFVGDYELIKRLLEAAHNIKEKT